MPTVVTRSPAGPRNVGATSDRYIFGLGQDWRTFLSVCAQTADEFRRNSIACGKQNLLMPHFRLFQWCIITVIGWRLGQQPGWPASGKQKIFL